MGNTIWCVFSNFSAYFHYARLILFFVLHFCFLRLGYPQFLLFMPPIPAFRFRELCSLYSWELLFCCFHFCFSYFLLPVWAFVGVCEGWIDACSISSSPAKKKTSLCGRSNSRAFCFTKKLLNVLNGSDAGTRQKVRNLGVLGTVSRQPQYHDADERPQG